jgi:tetratricopeptide (TPR) repeat protein
MRPALTSSCLLLLLLLLLGSTHGGARVAAQDAGVRMPAERETPAHMLEVELALLAKKKLAPMAANSVDELQAVLEDAHRCTLEGRTDEATLLLLEAVEGPRFRSFEGFDTFAAADLMLASLLLDQHALASGQRSVDRLLARGVQTPTFGPAYRRAVDLALASFDHTAAAARLTAAVPAPLPEDARSELHFLTGLSAHERNELLGAERELSAVSKKSRFYARAQYLLGAIAAAQHKLEAASARFCAVRQIASGAPRTRYEAAGLYPLEDLARLGMGRVAHEQGREKEAFDHYFQVPNDSPLVAEALFESAFASYERGQPQLALDSLEQLEARYPDSPYTAEARVLRGYVHLASCDFERAERELVTFEATFGGVLSELNTTLESPASTHSLFVAQMRAAKPDSLLTGLVRRDPEVEHLSTQLAALTAELARSSRTGAEFGELAARVRGKDAPHERVEPDETSELARIEQLRAQAGVLHEAIAALTRDLGTLRRAGAEAAELSALQKSERKLYKQTDAIEAALRQLVRAREFAREPPRGQELAERLQEERAYVEGVRSRALRVRAQLEGALADAERRALERLRGRLEKELRRAQIGRIDAVMGKKQKLELEVESLSAGRFPPELSSVRQTPALLSDDQEYWPFEGEDWPDEYQEPR